MKSWTEKLNSGKPHQVKPVPMNIAGMKKGQIMLIPTALMVDEFICNIPQGTSMNPRQMRDQLASQFDAQVTCPITTGIFLRIVAEAAWEAHENGTPVSEICPVWRVISNDTPTMKKITFDPQFLRDQRRKEGLDA